MKKQKSKSEFESTNPRNLQRETKTNIFKDAFKNDSTSKSDDENVANSSKVSLKEKYCESM